MEASHETHVGRLDLGDICAGLMQWGTTAIDDKVVNPKGNLSDDTVREIWKTCRECNVGFFDTAEGKRFCSMHGHHFRSVAPNGEIGALRDTLLVMPGEKPIIAFVADNPGSWLLHCHMLEHSLGGMSTWVQVV